MPKGKPIPFRAWCERQERRIVRELYATPRRKRRYPSDQCNPDSGLIAGEALCDRDVVEVALRK